MAWRRTELFRLRGDRDKAAAGARGAGRSACAWHGAENRRKHIKEPEDRKQRCENLPRPLQWELGTEETRADCMGTPRGSVWWKS